MAVYVDDARIPWRGHRWSHMIADTHAELLGAADALGIDRARVQDKGRTVHFDLPDPLRERAIALGVAEPIHWRDVGRLRKTHAREAEGRPER